jgi:hypothetical protein
MFTTQDKYPRIIKYCRKEYSSLPDDPVMLFYGWVIFLLILSIKFSMFPFIVTFSTSLGIIAILAHLSRCDYYTNALTELREIINDDNVLKNNKFVFCKTGLIKLPYKWEMYNISPYAFVIIDGDKVLKYMYSDNYPYGTLYLRNCKCVESDKTIVYEKEYGVGYKKHIIDFSKLNIVIDLEKENPESNKEKIIKCIHNIKNGIEMHKTNLIKICEENLKKNFEKYQNHEKLSEITEESCSNDIFFYEKDGDITYTQLFSEILSDLELGEKITPQNHKEKIHNIEIILTQISNIVIIPIVENNLDKIKIKEVKPILDELEK